jgi:hypothetical protein
MLLIGASINKGVAVLEIVVVELYVSLEKCKRIGIPSVLDQASTDPPGPIREMSARKVPAS